MSRALVVTADGGSRGNPGPAGYGAVVLDAATGEVLAEVKAGIGRATNNVAEYSGLIAGLRTAADVAPGAPVEVRMDSKLVVEQMSGRWQVRHADLRPLAAAAREAASRLGTVRYVWVPRERNAHADRLANEAMDAAAGKPAGPGTPQAAGGDPPERAGAGQSPGASRSGGNAVPGPAPRPARATPAAAAWQRAGGPPTTTVLLRHGETALSGERRFAGTGDAELTEAGLRQARAAAARIAARDGIALIITSPLRRARQTAAEAAAVTGAAVRIDEGLRETDFGKWEGATFGEAMQQWPAEMSAWLADPAAPPPGGESLADAAARIDAALDALLAAYRGRTLLLVSHVTPIKVIVARALLAPPAALHRMQLDVASLCEADWYADGPAVLRSFNDTAHLAGGRFA